MKYRKYFIAIFFLIIGTLCIAEDQKVADRFSDIWIVGSEDWKIEEYLIIKKIDEKYLVITADTDDNGASKGIGRLIADNIIEVELGKLTYKLVYGSEGSEEWIEMYLTPYDEEYPVYERIENFSIDKF